MLWGEAVEDRGEGGGDGFDGALCRVAEEMFERGEDLFDQVQVRRTGRQEQPVRTGAANCGADGAALVRAEVVHHDEIAGLEGGDERLLDPGGEALAVDPSPWSLGPVAFPWLDIEKAWGFDAVAAQGGEEGQRAPVAMRVMAWQAIPARCPTAQGGHVRLHPGFVNEDQPLRVDPVLMPAPPLPPAGHVGPVYLAGQRAFF